MSGRKRQMLDKVDHIERVLAETDLDRNAVAGRFGVLPNTLNEWLRKGEAPAWTLIACNALLREHADNKPKPRLLLVTVPEKKLEDFKGICAILRLSCKELDL